MTAPKLDEEALACPFCGASPEIEENQHRTKLRWEVSCLDCDCCGCIGETREDAIAKWNRRAPSAKEPQGWRPWPEVEARLDAITDLKIGWDSYRGNPITSEAIIAARQFMHNTLIVPLSYGGIQIEWHCGGVDLEIEIGADGKIEDPWFERVVAKPEEPRCQFCGGLLSILDHTRCGHSPAPPSEQETGS